MNAQKGFTDDSECLQVLAVFYEKRQSEVSMPLRGSTLLLHDLLYVGGGGGVRVETVPSSPSHLS